MSERNNQYNTATSVECMLYVCNSVLIAPDTLSDSPSQFTYQLFFLQNSD